MYDELIKNLRNCSEINSLSRYKRDLMKQAADAIEELQTKLKKAEIEINHLDGLAYSLQDELGNALY